MTSSSRTDFLNNLSHANALGSLFKHLTMSVPVPPTVVPESSKVAQALFKVVHVLSAVIPKKTALVAPPTLPIIVSPATALLTPMDDILRAEIVYIISAFDKLMHDIILAGLVESYMGLRAKTQKFKDSTVTMDLLDELDSGGMTPKEIFFKNFMRNKLKTLSFQHPDKVSDGLALIWDESQKWQQVSIKMNMDAKVIKIKLNLIVGRRNSIAHEFDYDPVNGSKYPIGISDVEDALKFVSDLGLAICDLTGF